MKRGHSASLWWVCLVVVVGCHRGLDTSLLDKPCTRDCAGRVCGDDGCNGSCGECGADAQCTTNGQCAPVCVPSCGARVCGDDGCEGSCGDCRLPATCTSDGRCEAPCTPSCGARVCGDDGCNGSCGDCAPTFDCDAVGACAPPAATVHDWRGDLLYLLLPDRFSNGDTSNDSAGEPACSVPGDPLRFHGGDIAGLRARVPYLAALGVTAVVSAPLYGQIGLHGNTCGYHGYWPAFTEPSTVEPDPRFGSGRELQELVGELRLAGMRLMLDTVVNHAGYGAPITAAHPSWFHGEGGCAALGDPLVTCPVEHLPDFAQEQPEVAAYVAGIGSAWAARYGFDGALASSAPNVPASFLANTWAPAMRAARANLFLAAEAWDFATLDDYLSGGGFDAVLDDRLRTVLIDTFGKGGSTDLIATHLAALDTALGHQGATYAIHFLDSHNVPRFGSASTWATADAKLTGYRLALVALFTAPGIPLLYYGDELGLLGDFSDNRADMPAWAFTAAERQGAHDAALPNAAGTYTLVQSLAAIRAASPALARGGYAELWRQNGTGADLFAFYRSDGGDRVIVVLHNGTLASGNVTMPFLDNPGISAADRAAIGEGGVFDELLVRGAPSTLQVSGGKLTLAMPPKSAAIYRARAR